MARLFNAYIMLDWTAAAAPKTGKDSVWIGVTKRDIRFRPTFEAFNPATRMEAEARLREVLADLKRRGESALIGFVSPLGYPEGTAAALKLKDPAWAGMWSFLASNVVDKKDNTNNRFAVANKMNRLMTDEARPFWGGGPRDVQRWLQATKPAAHGPDLPPLFRRTETARGAKAKTPAIWQLMGPGAVGGQAILAIPAARRLADELGPKAKVWPFDTGWKALGADDVAGLAVLIAEAAPIVSPPMEPGEVPDRALVRALCDRSAKLDDQGKLGAAFAPPAGVSAADLKAVEREEGWALEL